VVWLLQCGYGLERDCLFVPLITAKNLNYLKQSLQLALALAIVFLGDRLDDSPWLLVRKRTIPIDRLQLTLLVLEFLPGPTS
jgi:hypothetical protein